MTSTHVRPSPLCPPPSRPSHRLRCSPRFPSPHLPSALPPSRHRRLRPSRYHRLIAPSAPPPLRLLSTSSPARSLPRTITSVAACAAMGAAGARRARPQSGGGRARA
eukprot:3652619-Prymnesium_polylepis.1